VRLFLFLPPPLFFFPFPPPPPLFLCPLLFPFSGLRRYLELVRKDDRELVPALECVSSLSFPFPPPLPPFSSFASSPPRAPGNPDIAGNKKQRWPPAAPSADACPSLFPLLPSLLFPSFVFSFHPPSLIRGVTRFFFHGN